MRPEFIILPAFILWCIGVFFFLRRMSARGEESAAEPDPDREGIDDLVEKVEEHYPPRDSDERKSEQE